jgi:hypothetical protein
MGMRAAIGVLLLVCASTVQAQVIYKCRDAKGSTVFQNAPCPPNSIAVQAKAYDTGQPSNAALWQAYNAKKEMEARNVAMHTGSYAYRGPTEPTDRDKQKERCRLARVAEQKAISQGASAEVRAALSRAEIDACFGL